MKHLLFIRSLVLIGALLLTQNTLGIQSRFYGAGQLSSSLITTLHQDDKGYIWIGTEYGLNKFDGLHFIEYLHNEHDSLSIMSNGIRSLNSDREGNLWVGFQTGLQRYDAGSDTFHRVTFEGTGYTPNVSAIKQLSSGEIWLIVSRLGIFTLNPEQMTARPLSRVTELCDTDHINHFHEDSHKRIWIATEERGIYCIENDFTRVTHYALTNAAKDPATLVETNRNGMIIAAGGGKIFVFNEIERRFEQLRVPQNLYLDTYDLLQRPGGDFIVATFRNGLWRINEEKKALEEYAVSFPNELNIRNANTVKLMEDSEGNLWCGCFQRGIVMIPSAPATFDVWDFSTIEKLPHRNDYGATMAIYKLRDGTLLAGTQDGTLFELDEAGNMLRRRQLSGDASAFLEDERGRIWIGVGYSGLYTLNRATGTLTAIPEFNGQRVKSLTLDREGRIYVGLLGGGIWRYDPRLMQGTPLPTSDRENQRLLRNSYVNRLFIDSKERLWIGHYLGVSCYDTRNEQYLDIATDALLNRAVTYALTESRDGSIWIGTNSGLFVWNEQYGRYERYTTDNGLSSNMICGLAEDRSGDIWCSTFRGINRLNIQDNSIINYYAGSGATKREYIRGSYCSDGTAIFFGDSYGITRFQSPISRSNTHREVLLTRMYIGNQPVTSLTRTRSGDPVSEQPLTETNQLRLSHNQNTLTLFFSTMTFRKAENIRFRYRLTGLGSEWNTTPQGQYSITYNHLRPGRYTLDVYADEDGVMNGARRIHIRIDRPWYATLPAFILYAVVLVAISWLIIGNIRRRRREEINETRLKFYVNVAHEIRSPMVMVLNPIESLLKRTTDRESIQALQTMQRNTKRIIRLLGQFLDIRKLDTGQMTVQRQLCDLVAHITESLSAYSYQTEKRNIRLAFDHPMESMLFQTDPNHLDTIMANLITNALKFTPDGGEIIVGLSFRQDTGEAEICVSDSGPGIDENELERIFDRFYQGEGSQESKTRGFGIGLNLCRMLVELQGGCISAANRRDRRGAIFTILLPQPHGLIAEGDSSEQAPMRTILNEQSATPKRERNVRSKSRHRILVIDDDEEIRLFLEESLSDTYKILTAGDGEQGLQRALTELPDLIVSDVLMPGLNGLQLLKRLKSHPNTSHIPTILLTSKAEQSDRIEGLEFGADGYMAKPFHIDELQILIDNLLKNRQRIRGKFSGAHQEDKIKEVELKANNDVLMERVMKIVNDNLDNPELKVEMLAEEVGLSRAQLHRRLKELTGISSGEFIRNIRLKKAAELLAERKVNISQVAYMVGFSSQTHFSTAFRKFYGISPTEYLNRKEDSATSDKDRAKEVES